MFDSFTKNTEINFSTLTIKLTLQNLIEKHF